MLWKYGGCKTSKKKTWKTSSRASVRCVCSGLCDSTLLTPCKNEPLINGEMLSINKWFSYSDIFDKMTVSMTNSDWYIVHVVFCISFFYRSQIFPQKTNATSKKASEDSLFPGVIWQKKKKAEPILNPFKIKQRFLSGSFKKMMKSWWNGTGRQWKWLKQPQTQGRLTVKAEAPLTRGNEQKWASYFKLLVKSRLVFIRL